MDKNNLLKAAFIVGILLLIVGDVVAQTEIVQRINCIVCRIAYILLIISSVIAGIVILMAGIKWVSSPDDPAARGAARLTIVHAIMGLIIIIISLYLVQYVVGSMLPEGGLNPADWFGGCSTTCTGL